VANSSIGDFREALQVGADLVSHLPCYQDTMSDPDSPYYDVDTVEKCLVSEEEAEKAAAIGMASVLIVSQWTGDRPEPYVDWERLNIAMLEAAGAPLAVGSNAYGSTVIDGLIAGAEKGYLEPSRLLRLATTDTARAIFPGRRVGCLAVGCEASFLVLDGNPLDDFSNIRSIRMRVKDGEPLMPEEIDASEES
jgi:imidazolonepropionase-like amidohydrolase